MEPILLPHTADQDGRRVAADHNIRLVADQHLNLRIAFVEATPVLCGVDSGPGMGNDTRARVATPHVSGHHGV